MSYFQPLGPPVPKKPKPKQHKFMDDLYGYTSCGEELAANVELYAWSEEDADFRLVETNEYTTINNVTISVIDGIIQ